MIVATERALVIVPTYNERANVAEMARRLFDAAGGRVSLLVVDDSSPDGTAEIVKQIAEGPNDVHLLQRPGKQGLGSAYRAGFEWALEHGYESVVEMDADLSHDPADVPRLLDALAGADLVIGSRYVAGGGTRNWSKLRMWLSRGANVYARAWLGFDVRDSTAGFRAYRTGWLQELDMSSVTSEGYAFQVEMTFRTYQAGKRIVEVPITFIERVEGRSKMSRRIVLEALLKIAGWGVRSRRGSA
ncbi:MAG: dolichol-phosphate mannosyltransferase [Actinomycetota bacterium]|jgi:glycosyltransferase involved in cell wall biosynthesis|nr:dolichol-phosphate mannosyltransferase [Actinomycetota bacterium]